MGPRAKGGPVSAVADIIMRRYVAHPLHFPSYNDVPSCGIISLLLNSAWKIGRGGRVAREVDRCTEGATISLAAFAEIAGLGQQCAQKQPRRSGLADRPDEANSR